jgi:predicted trehalose synthase
MSVLDEVRVERELQDEQWGTVHDDHHSFEEWVGLLRERVRKVNAAPSGTKARREAVTLAALAVALAETFDRRDATAVSGVFHPTHSE